MVNLVHSIKAKKKQTQCILERGNTGWETLEAALKVGKASAQRISKRQPKKVKSQLYIMGCKINLTKMFANGLIESDEII